MPMGLLGLISTSDSGTWPQTWPAELDPLRKQARTIGVATGIQQDIHEIPFTDRAQFSDAWPAILKLRTPHAPVTLYWTDSPPPKSWGTLLSTGRPMVRIYAPTGGFSGVPGTENIRTVKEMETALKDGKMLKPGPPWPAEIESTNGALPEFVKSEEVNGRLKWVPARLEEEAKKPSGFLNRARVDLDIVVDGEIIDLSRVHFPRETIVHSDRHPIPDLTDEQRLTLVREASAAFREHVKGDPKDRSNEIPSRFWGPTISSLKPLRVVDDRVNIKIVIADKSGVEAGFYVNQTISSFAPRHDYFLEHVSLPHSTDETFGSLYRYKQAAPTPAVPK